MDTAGTPRRRRPFEARPGVSALVAPDLATLTGPTRGVVELPISLCWQPNRAFDLASDYRRRALYQNVLREAGRYADLDTFLNRDVLLELWPRLVLPKGVRAAWERAHPELHVPLAAAA
ncbi:hypothetical protein R8Z50_15755 [Longispora sp. K20-0274]|uniref:hypothetical protein n=1 Tax=Longispora sp. K20-0274 TaxID=3088255 RepID=UPI00399A1DF9